jgi:hypothetical protein
MKALPMWIIAACLVAQTVSVYETFDGGINVFIGGFGYHFEGSN